MDCKSSQLRRCSSSNWNNEDCMKNWGLQRELNPDLLCRFDALPAVKSWPNRDAARLIMTCVNFGWDQIWRASQRKFFTVWQPTQANASFVVYCNTKFVARSAALKFFDNFRAYCLTRSLEHKVIQYKFNFWSLLPCQLQSVLQMTTRLSV